MRIAIAQLDYTIGAFGPNLELIRTAVARSRDAGADLVVLSELATIGYPPGDMLERTDVVDANLVQLRRIAELSSGGPAILAGFVARNEAEVGKPLLNSAALCVDGRVVASTVKCLLPTYDVFDEARYFEPGGSVRPLELAGVRLGVTICEDAWSDPELLSRQLYRRDPVREVVEAGAQLLVNLSASPFTLGKAAQRRDMVRRHAVSSGLPFVLVNQVGANDELVFDGHSLVFDGSGRVVVRARDFAEDLLVCEIPESSLTVPPVRLQEATVRDVADSGDEEAYRALVLGLGDYARKTGFRQAVLGLSGGIDSALTAAVAAEAFGAANVLGVAMPTRYSTDGSLRDAEGLAGNLGIDFRVIPIDHLFQSFLDTMAPSFDGLARDVTEENLQARARGTVLMALSNKLHRLLLATGNKSELAVGYCTLYGDMCGALAVLGDVSKTLVYRLARHVNRDRELIPASTIAKPPSAELRPDQKDQDSLPPYEVLDRILEEYVERGRSVEEIIAGGCPAGATYQVVALIDGAEYKRRQAAPVIKISSKAFGIGRRYPIVADYRHLHGADGPVR